MGKVIVTAKLQNWFDVEKLAAGDTQQPARAAEVEALVDTGATQLYLQESLARRLGLRPLKTVTSRTMSDRLETRTLYSAVDLELCGRSTQMSVVGIPDTLPNLIGQVPLELMDLVVDCREQKVIPNPAHPDGPLFEEF